MARLLPSASARGSGCLDVRALRRAGLVAAVALLPLLGACQRTGAPAPVATGTIPSAFGGTMIVERGDSVSAIAKRYEIPFQDLVAANNLTPPYNIQPGQRLILPPIRQYTVQRGDTLYGIARMLGVDANDIIHANNLAPPFTIMAGQNLRLPGSGAAPSAPIGEAAAPPPATSHRDAVETTALPPPGVSPAAEAKPAAPPAQPPRHEGTPLPPPQPAAEDQTKHPPGKPQTLVAPPAEQPKPVEAKPATPVKAPETKPAPAKPSEPPPPEAKSPAEPPAAKPAEDAKPAKEEPPPPAAQPADGPAVGGDGGNGQFLWPVKGKLISGYGPKPDGTHNDGLNIAASKGTSVVAADAGTVAYSGNELKGFGNLLLIRHANGWMTAYAHLDRLQVERGAKVKRGQVIGTVGQSGSVDSPQLHFEIRKGSTAVDPTGHM